MFGRDFGSLLFLLSLGCLIAIRCVDSRSASDIETDRRAAVKRAAEFWSRSDARRVRNIRSLVNLDSEADKAADIDDVADDDDDDANVDPNPNVDVVTSEEAKTQAVDDETLEDGPNALTVSDQDEPGNSTASNFGEKYGSQEEVDMREPEYFYNFHLHDRNASDCEGLPEKYLIGSRKSFEFVCPQPCVQPRSNHVDCVKLTESPWFSHRYVIELVPDYFFKLDCSRVNSAWITCLSEYKTSEYYHRNISVCAVPLVYAPLRPKAELAVASNPPAGCGSKRVNCSARANPSANWILKRVIYDDAGKFKSYEALNVSEECIIRDNASSNLTFYTRQTGHFACFATNEYGMKGAAFTILDPDMTIAIAFWCLLAVLIALCLLIICCEWHDMRALRKSSDGEYLLEWNGSEKSKAAKLDNEGRYEEKRKNLRELSFYLSVCLFLLLLSLLLQFVF